MIFEVEEFYVVPSQRQVVEITSQKWQLSALQFGLAEVNVGDNKR